MTIRTINVDVDVDLGDFSDTDLIKEIESRSLSLAGVTDDDITDLATRMYTAFSLGKDAEAMSIARQLAQDVTGRLL